MAPPRAPPRGPCAGLGCNLCRWCFGPLAVSHEHGEDGCSSRQKPSLADWTRYAATQPELCVRRATRTAADSSAAEAPLRGRKQTDRSTEEQAAYRAAYMRWYASEAKRLGAEASAVLAERVALLLQLLAPSSESGEFSDQSVETSKITGVSSVCAPSSTPSGSGVVDSPSMYQYAL